MDKFFKESNKQTKLLILFFALGLLVFLSIAFLVPFKDKLFNSLYPKSASQAASVKKASKEPRFVPGELVVKFRSKVGLQVKQGVGVQSVDIEKKPVAFSALDDKSTPEVLRVINQRYKIKTIEKVYKNREDLKAQTGKLKSRVVAQAVPTTDSSQTYVLALGTGEIKDARVRNEKLREVMEQLVKSREFTFVSPNYLLKASRIPNDPYYLDSYPGTVNSRDANWNPSFDYQWDLKKMSMEKAWEITRGSLQVKVAVVDTGVDYTHPDLGGCSIKEVRDDLCEKVAPGYNFISCDEYNLDTGACMIFHTPDDNPLDDHGHGTHVAGSITSSTNNSAGIAGINWSGRILPVKVLNSQGFGALDEILAGLQFAVDNGASVINMSFGGLADVEFGGYTPYDDVFSQANNLNVVLVAAAGNSNENISLGFYPANHSKVMAVGATDYRDQKASFSNYGSKLSVAAPGVDILSLKATGTDMYTGAPDYTGQRVIGGNYLYASGTSMASPHVAGLAALILAKNPNLTSSQVQSIIEYTADDIGIVGFDTNFGWGRINAEKALSLSGIPPVVSIQSPRNGDILANSSIQIRGTAQAADFQNYTVSVGIGANPTAYSATGITLANGGNTAVENGLLATLTTNGYTNKDIVIKLEVSDKNGLKRQSYVSLFISGQIPFLTPVVVNSASPSMAAYPSASLSGDSDFGVSWRYGEYGNIYFNKSTDSGKTFTPDTALTAETSETTLGEPSLQNLGTDTLVAFGKSPKRYGYEDYLPGIPLQIVLEKYTNATIGTTVPLIRTIDNGMAKFYQKGSDGSYGYYGYNYYPTVHSAVDKLRNVVYLVWQAGDTFGNYGYIYFTKFNNQTNSFEATKIVKTINSDSGDPQPSITVDSKGKIYIAWVEETNLSGSLFRRINIVTSADSGSSFSDPQMVYPGADKTCSENHPELTTDDQDALYVVFLAADTSDMECYPRPYLWITKSTNGGSSFSSPINLSSNIRSGYGLFSISNPVVNSKGVFIAANKVMTGYTYLIQTDKALQNTSAAILVPGNESAEISNQVKLTATDNKDLYVIRDIMTFPRSGTTSQIVSTKTAFLGKAPTPVSQNLSLSAGWNLVGLTVNKANYKAGDLIADLNAGGNTVTQIIRWNNGSWDSATFSNGTIFGNNFDILPGEGYFVKSSSYVSKTLTGGSVSLSSLSLSPGWNLISLPFIPSSINKADTLAAELTRQGLTTTSIVRWYNGAWQTHIANFPVNKFDIVAGQGYFVNLSVGGVFTLPAYSQPLSVQPLQKGKPCTLYTTDIDKNSRVTGNDLGRFVACNNKRLTDKDKKGNLCKASDTNADLRIDKADYDCIRANIGKSYTLLKETKPAGAIPSLPR